MSNTKNYLEKVVSSKRDELQALQDEVDALVKENDETTDEAKLEEIGSKAEELKAKIEDLKAQLKEAEDALAELEKPEEPAPTEEPEAKKEDDNKDCQRSLKQITEKRGMKMDNQELELRAKQFAETNKMVLNTKEQRSTLISGGTIATPTGVSGINDAHNAVSSIVDMVNIVDCEGMGSNKIAYESAGSTAASQTEGSAASASDPTFGYVTITPTSKAVLSYVSNQVKKQSPLNYEDKIKKCSLDALRKAASSMIVSGIYASSIVATKNGTVASSKGVINEKTLRDIALAYGGDENVMGDAVLFLNKTDLIAFGDVRGTNDKKAVYEITPDSANPNTGIIQDGGLAVKYCINSNCNAYAGTSQTTSAVKTMFYGQPKACELDLFSNYEVAVSDDYKFAENMLSIRGSVDLGTDVVVKDGFVVFTLPATI